MTVTKMWSPDTLLDAESRYAGIGIYKAAFQAVMHIPILVSMTTYCEGYVFDIDQCYTAMLMQLAHSTFLKWSPESHMRTASYEDARSK